MRWVMGSMALDWNSIWSIILPGLSFRRGNPGLTHYGIEFNHLLTITNMPVRRFLHSLERSGQLQEYMELLVHNFNVQAALGVMCLNLVSVGWNGQLYDCDFNQMLEIPMGRPDISKVRTIRDITSLDDLMKEKITIADHCYGCTAGAGSSCGGAIVAGEQENGGCDSPIPPELP